MTESSEVVYTVSVYTLNCEKNEVSNILCLLREMNDKKGNTKNQKPQRHHIMRQTTRIPTLMLKMFMVKASQVFYVD